MRIRSVSYSMLRITKQFENDRVEVSVEVAEGDSVRDAVRLAKRTCEEALAQPSKRAPSKSDTGTEERAALLELD